MSWTANDAVVSTEANFTYTVSENVTLRANFTQEQQPTTPSYHVAVGVNPSGTGTVSVNGGSYASGYTGYKDEGTELSLSAKASTGYEFVNWTNNGTVVSTSADFTFEVTAASNLQANFQATPQKYMVSVNANPNGTGTVTLNGEKYAGTKMIAEGTELELSASPSNGYRFVSWTDNDVVVSTDPDFTYTVTDRANLVANFELVPVQYLVNINANPISTGGITINGESSNGYSGMMDEGEQVVLTASPASGYRFVNWTINGVEASTETSFAYTVEANATIQANFERVLEKYFVNINASPIGTGSITVDGKASSGYTGRVEEGTQIELTASAASGWRFVGWFVNDELASANSDYTFTVTGRSNVYATFERIPESYLVNINANPIGTGSITINGESSNGYTGMMEEDETVELTAQAAEGYRFVNWTANGEVVSTESDFTYTIEGAATLQANFERESVVDPTDPTDPTDPADPTDPTDPADPTEPVTPTDPATPTDPDDAGDDPAKDAEDSSDSADDPAKDKADKKSSDDKDKTPKTADDSAYLLSGAGVAALAALAMATVARRRVR